MAHIQQQDFCNSVKEKFPDFFKDSFVLDVGSLDINGNNQYLFEGGNYLGVDVAVGRNVDVVAKGHELMLPDATFDVIVSTECFEHDQYYDATLRNIVRLLKPGGLFLFTCATTGRPEHGTRRTTPDDAPLLQNFGEWSDYYKNLTEEDIRAVIDVDLVFGTYAFSIGQETHDLYFFGIKRGVLDKQHHYSCFFRNDPLQQKMQDIVRQQAQLSAEQTALINQSFERQTHQLLTQQACNQQEVCRLGESVLTQLQGFADRQLQLQTEQAKQFELITQTLDGVNRQLLEHQALIRGESGHLSQFLAQQAAAQQEICRLHGEIYRLQGDVSEIHHSRSWRITAPLRLIAGTLRHFPLTRKAINYRHKVLPYIRRYGLRQTVRRIGQIVHQHDLPLAAASAYIRFEKVSYVLTTPHCDFVAGKIVENLGKLGIEGRIVHEEPATGYGPGLHFVICPQMFSRLPSIYIAFQMEQSVSSRWFDQDYLRVLENSFAIFDYSEANLQFLQKSGLSYKQMHYMPLGVSQTEIMPEAEEKVDVLFYGDINNDRRREFLGKVSACCTVKVINDQFGPALLDEIRQAKVIINVHYYEGALLETTRLFECLSLDKLIVSEKAADQHRHVELEQIVDFVDVGDIDGMVERVLFWLENEEARREKIKSNRAALAALPDWFEYYFMRFMLSCDFIDFEEFYRLAAHNVRFDAETICLGLPESVDRRLDFERDNKYGIQYFPGLRHAVGWVGCGLSYKFIMRKAREQGYTCIAVCEDDVKLPEDWLTKYPIVKSYFAAQQDCDLFSGFIADLKETANIRRLENYQGMDFVEIDRMTSMVFNLYSGKFFDKLAGWDPSVRDAEHNTIDRFIEAMPDLRVITTLPFLVGHKAELHSTLWGFQNTTYETLITESSQRLSEKVAAFRRNVT